MTARAITPAQIRAVHAALTRRGIDDDTYRAMLAGHFEAASCKELTAAQANELLNLLNKGRRRSPDKPPRRRQPIKNPAPTPPVDGKIIHLPSRAQLALIEQLCEEIEWRLSYKAWLKKSQGLTAVRTTTEASGVIQGLKKMKRVYPRTTTEDA